MKEFKFLIKEKELGGYFAQIVVFAEDLDEAKEMAKNLLAQVNANNDLVFEIDCNS